MTIYYPPIYTAMHQGEIKDGVPVHEQAMRKLVANFNFFGKLMPVGVIIFVQVNQVGVTVPDSNVWQLCDGSKITHPDSPIRSIGADEKFTPNLSGKYPRCANDQLANAVGGTQTFALAHDHNGITGQDFPLPPVLYQAGGDRRHRTRHQHPISSDLGSTTVDYPKYLKYVAYLKIV